MRHGPLPHPLSIVVITPSKIPTTISRIQVPIYLIPLNTTRFYTPSPSPLDQYSSPININLKSLAMSDSPKSLSKQTLSLQTSPAYFTHRTLCGAHSSYTPHTRNRIAWQYVTHYVIGHSICLQGKGGQATADDNDSSSSEEDEEILQKYQISIQR